MAYTYSDANGYLDLGPTVNGLRQIKKLRATAKGTFPGIDQLLKLGYTNLLVELADTVTEMREVKHAYQRGILAQRGIEF